MGTDKVYGGQLNAGGKEGGGGGGRGGGLDNPTMK